MMYIISIAKLNIFQANSYTNNVFFRKKEKSFYK